MVVLFASITTLLSVKLKLFMVEKNPNLLNLLKSHERHPTASWLREVTMLFYIKGERKLLFSSFGL